MNETVENAAVEQEVPVAAAEETAVPQQETKNQEEMPKEERAKQASRRRAVEQLAEELRASDRERKLQQEVLNHPLVKEAVSLLEQTRFQKDLEQVREAYPELSAARPEEVGEVYCRLMASGQVDPVVAYEAQVAFNRRSNPVPEDMVSARSSGGAPLYYSSAELDRLTEKDLKNPDIFRKAMSSLSKLGR